MSGMKEAADLWDNFSPEDYKPRPMGSSSGERRAVVDLEDGDYVVRIVAFRYWLPEPDEDGKAKGHCYKWGLEVDDGLMKGSFVEKWQSATEIGLKILAQDMFLLLGELPPMGDIYNPEENRAGNVWANVVGKRIKMRKGVNKNGYNTFYFNQVVSDDVADAGDDDDIPF